MTVSYQNILRELSSKQRRTRVKSDDCEKDRTFCNAEKVFI
jgi:hypothetical protein